MQKNLLFLSLLLLISYTYAAMEVSSVSVEINLDSKGKVFVTEKISIRMDNELDVVDYNKAAEVNTFQNWIKTLNNPNIRLHVDASKASIKNLQIRPQPVRTLLGGKFMGVILITYEVEEGGNNSLFIREEVKPRVVKYKLNPDILSFERTASGNIILNKGLVLSINLPKDSLLLDINPLPKNIKDIELPQSVEQVYWRDQILVEFRLEVIIEKSITEEISDYFEGSIQKMATFLSTEEGIAYLSMGVVLLGSYLYIISKMRGLKHGVKQK